MKKGQYYKEEVLKYRQFLADIIMQNTVEEKAEVVNGK